MIDTEYVQETPLHVIVLLVYVCVLTRSRCAHELYIHSCCLWRVLLSYGLGADLLRYVCTSVGCSRRGRGGGREGKRGEGRECLGEKKEDTTRTRKIRRRKGKENRYY